MTGKLSATTGGLDASGGMAEGVEAATQTTEGPRSGRLIVISALIAVLGLMITAGFLYRVEQKAGVYWSNVRVLFLAPSSAATPNALIAASSGLASTAGVVSRLVDPTAPRSKVVSPEVTLATEGVRHGYWVRLPNDGGQFTNNFDQPLLDVQAVGSTPQEVTATMNRILNEIDAKTASLQEKAGVPELDRIHTTRTPGTIAVLLLEGSKVRALAATLAIGITITCAVVFGFLRAAWARRWFDRPDSSPDLS
jgi:hypothetical protein